MYTDLALDHFRHPRNVGRIAHPDGSATVTNAPCGDRTRIYIRVRDGRLAEVKFQTLGCPAAIATSSMLTELALGRPLDEATAITHEQVADALGGLPHRKQQCSNLAADALRAAIRDYQARRCRGGTLPS